MATDPIVVDSTRFRLLQNLAETFRSLRKADGFAWDVKATSVYTEPTNILTLPSTDLPVYLLEVAPGSQMEFRPANQVECSLLVSVTARAEATGLDPDRKLKVWEALIADIEKAVTRDITRGGLATDTRLQDPLPIVGMGSDSLVLVVQNIEVRYWRTYGRP